MVSGFSYKLKTLIKVRITLYSRANSTTWKFCWTYGHSCLLLTPNLKGMHNYVSLFNVKNWQLSLKMWALFSSHIQVRMSNVWVQSRGFNQIFSRRATGFTGDNIFWTKLLYKKNFPLDGQTREAKSTSQLVTLPSAQPLMKPMSKNDYS